MAKIDQKEEKEGGDKCCLIWSKGLMQFLKTKDLSLENLDEISR